MLGNKTVTHYLIISLHVSCKDLYNDYMENKHKGLKQLFSLAGSFEMRINCWFSDQLTLKIVPLTQQIETSVLGAVVVCKILVDTDTNGHCQQHHSPQT